MFATRDSPSRLVQLHRPWQMQVRQLQMQTGPDLPGPPDEEPKDKRSKSKKKKSEPDEDEEPKWDSTLFKMFESALTTLASVAILGLVGYGYTRYYKYMVLEKMENAFKPGDPVLELAATTKLNNHEDEELTDEGKSREHWVLREEQQLIDAIVAGRTKGQYHLLVGEKGTGKSSMLIDAMAKIDGEGCAMFDAHADPEIFRIRLGKALDFEVSSLRQLARINR